MILWHDNYSHSISYSIIKYYKACPDLGAKHLRIWSDRLLGSQWQSWVPMWAIDALRCKKMWNCLVIPDKSLADMAWTWCQTYQRRGYTNCVCFLGLRFTPFVYLFWQQQPSNDTTNPRWLSCNLLPCTIGGASFRTCNRWRAFLGHRPYTGILRLWSYAVFFHGSGRKCLLLHQLQCRRIAQA